MSPETQPALEQAAREWLLKNGFYDLDTLVEALATLLAAQRAAVLEGARQKFFDNAMTDAQFGEWLCTQAQEQRP